MHSAQESLRLTFSLILVNAPCCSARWVLPLLLSVGTDPTVAPSSAWTCNTCATREDAERSVLLSAPSACRLS